MPLPFMPPIGGNGSCTSWIPLHSWRAFLISCLSRARLLQALPAATLTRPACISQSGWFHAALLVCVRVCALMAHFGLWGREGQGELKPGGCLALDVGSVHFAPSLKCLLSYAFCGCLLFPRGPSFFILRDPQKL